MERSPEERARTPLARPEWLAHLAALREHPHAPRWNYAAGDRLDAGDLRWLDGFRSDLAAGRGARTPGEIPIPIADWIERRRVHVPLFDSLIPTGIDLARDWDRIGTMSRDDVAARLADIVPDDADLDRITVYFTSGTTHRPLDVPSDRRATAAYQALVETALGVHGVGATFSPGQASCFQVGALVSGICYATLLSAWNGSGFAKLNLHRAFWSDAGARPYFEAFDPRIISGDPVSLGELLRLAPRIRPLAVLSTATDLTQALAARLCGAWGAPVIDWYSLTETGPLACSCPRGRGLHVLPHDVYIEVVDPAGRALPAGERGELAVTGGRNPFLPLLRYRTGDRGRLAYDPCPCGDSMPRIEGFTGRASVPLRAADGSLVSAIDVARVLRRFAVAGFALLQRADLSCELAVRPVPGAGDAEGDAIAGALRAIFGTGASVRVVFDPTLGDDGKIVPIRSEVAL